MLPHHRIGHFNCPELLITGCRLLIKIESHAFIRCFSTGPERLLQESRRSHLHQRPQDQGWGRVSLNCKFGTFACASNMIIYLGGDKNLLFFSLVEFADKESMEYAIDKMDGTELGGRKIEISQEKSAGIGSGRRSRSRSPRR